MSKYKAKLIWYTGEEEILMADDSYDDALFDTKEEAEYTV